MKATEFTEVIAEIREQVLYLQELGVETLDVKLPEIRLESRDSRVESRELRVESGARPAVSGRGITESKIEISVRPVETPKPAETRPPGSRLAELPSLSKRRSVSPPRREETPAFVIREEPPVIPPAVSSFISPLPEPIETIEHICAEIGLDCARCPLHALGRKQVVNSVGNFDADLMFVGEAPGADEDQKGEPFVGRAGQLLTDIIKAIGFSREEVFIGNINRCRPPGNRAPEPDESAICKPFLKREIAVVRPRVIVVLGATAAQNLLETKVPIGKLRGNFQDYMGVKVMPTFHPAYLLRDPHKKREVWEDMKIVRDYLRS